MMFLKKFIFFVYFLKFVIADKNPYDQCGGVNYVGETTCIIGYQCYIENNYFSQCLYSCPSGWDCETQQKGLTTPSPIGGLEYDQCGGLQWTGVTSCNYGLFCHDFNPYYSQCLRICPIGLLCKNANQTLSTTSKSTSTYSMVIATLTETTNSIVTSTATILNPTKISISSTKTTTVSKSSIILSTKKTTTKKTTTKKTTTKKTTTRTTTTKKTTTRTTTTKKTTKKPKCCNFEFGIAYSQNLFDYSFVDYIAVWLGWQSFDQDWTGAALRKCVEFNKKPVIYSYVIGYMANELWNLVDCNQGEPNLCQKGADFIRTHRNDIISNYKIQSLEVAKIIGKYSEVVWLIEPDFWQYYGDKNQINGTLGGICMRQLFDNIVKAIKFNLPNSKISWDIKISISEKQMCKWWKYFSNSKNIDYIHTSSGFTQSNSKEIQNKQLKWSFMNNLTRKKIIADTGFTSNCKNTTHDNGYNNSGHIRARIKDGVIAVTQAFADNNWKSVLNKLRPKLPKLC